MKKSRIKSCLSSVVAILVVLVCNSDVQAQRRPIQIGGPNGIIMGGGMGFKVGGRNGVHFGGGQGAKFGPSQFGMHFGNGQGARFGGQNLGMQFGGGQGARFGTPQNGMQFGNGEGARFGQQGRPLMQFGGGQGAKIGPAQIGGRNNITPAQPSIITPTPIKPNGIQQPQTIPTPTSPNIAPSIAPGIAPDNNGGAINIRLPQSAKEPLEYSLNGSKFNIQPGAKVNLRNDHRWDFRFESGQGNIMRRYAQLAPGNYVLRQANDGWKLFSEEPVVQNPGSPKTPREAKVLAPAKTKSAHSILELDDSKDR